MALSKTARIWVIILAIPAFLIVVGMIAAKLYFTSDRLKALVIPRIEEATNRPVAVENISLTVFPSVGVSVDGLRLSNPRGSRFERDEFVAMENLDIRVKLLPLLRNRFEVSRVVVKRPMIYLEVTEDGQKNYSEKGARQRGSREVLGEEDQVPTGALVLSNLQIKEGQIESVNKRFDSRWMITGLDAVARAETTPEQNSIGIEAQSTIEGFSYGTVSSWYLSGQPITSSSVLTYKITDDILSFDRVSGKLREIPFTVGGSIAKLRQDTLAMDLRVESAGAQMEQLLSLIPPELLKKAEGLTSTGDVNFDLAISGPSSDEVNPATIGSFSVANGTIRYGELPKSITNVNVTGSFEKPSAPITRKDIGKFLLEKFSARLGSSDVRGSVKVSNFANPSLTANFAGSLDLGEVKEYYPLETGTEMNGLIKGEASIDGKAKDPKSLRANGTIDFKYVNIKTAGSPKPIRNLNGTIVFNNQLIESKQFAMNIGSSDLDLAFSVRNYLGLVVKDTVSNVRPRASVTLTSRELHTADLMPAPDDVASKAEESRDREGVRGGLLPGIDLDANVSVDKLVTDKFTFTNARGSVTVSDGIVNLKNFNVNAFQGAIQTRGTLDVRNLARRPFNLELDIKAVESNALLPAFTSFGSYLFGKLSMSTKLQGDLNDTLGLYPQSLLGNGKVEVDDGRLAGFPLTQKLSAFTGLDELREVNFKDWTNSFSIADGRFVVKDLKVNAGPTDFLVSGSQGLDGSLDYALTVKLPDALAGKLKVEGLGSELIEFMKDKEGRLNLTFAVGGTAKNPSLRLDLEAQRATAKKALEEKAEAEKKKLEEDLKKKAEEGLKKLFKRP